MTFSNLEYFYIVFIHTHITFTLHILFIYIKLKEYFHTYIYLLHVFLIELQEGKSMVNGDSRFMINLSQDQKEQYGSQFEEDNPDETPGILGELSN